MVVFDSIEDIFQRVRELSEYSRALVTLATALGTLLAFYITIKVSCKLIQGTRLYILSQLPCCQVDYRKRYGQWAVVSGSTDGIGLAMAKDLARRGMSIVVIGRNQEKLERTKNMLETEHQVEVVTVRIDLSDSSPENFERIRSQIDPDNRDIGILINNAGTLSPRFVRFNDLGSETFHDIVNVNIMATLYLTKMIMPGMLARSRGLVMNVSSSLGSFASPYMNVYPPSKAFIDSFTEQLQMEYSSSPIDIILMKPGAVYTKLYTSTSSNMFKDRPSILAPMPEHLAHTALNAIGTRIDTMSGTVWHGLSHEMVTMPLYKLGLVPILAEMLLLEKGDNNAPVQGDQHDQVAASN